MRPRLPFVVVLVQLVLLSNRPRTGSATLRYAPAECDDLMAVGSFFATHAESENAKKGSLRVESIDGISDKGISTLFFS